MKTVIHEHYLAFLVLIMMIILLRVIRFINKRSLIQKRSSNTKPSTQIIKSSDIRAISGDDMLSTQLDLARAYMEMNKKKLAKQILSHVQENGNDFQQQEAQKLLNQL